MGRLTTLRVLNWNVHGLRDDVGALAATVASSGAHLFVVQEAPRLFRWRSRCAELARRCGMVVVAGGGGDACGNLLLASVAVRVHAARSRRLVFLPGEQPRGAAVAECSLAGARFTALGTHLSLHPAERLRQVPALLAGLPEDGPPLVLAGDLNEQPGGPTWDAFADRLDDAAVSYGDDTPTFSTDNPRRRIDAIWVDRRMTVERYTVLDTPLVRRASDHFPLVAEVKLEEATAG